MHKERIWGLDLLKVIASFLVTFYHFQYIDYGFIPGEFYLPNINRLLMNLCVVSVPLFFMCNGAILLTKDSSMQKMLRRIVKIALLIAIWHWLPFPDWFFRTLIALYVVCPILKWIISNKRWMVYCILCAFLVVPFGLNLVTTLLKAFSIPYIITVGSLTLNLTEMNNTGVFTSYALMYFVLGGLLLNKRLSKAVSISLVVIGFSLVNLEGIIYTNYTSVIYDNVNASFPTIGALCMSVGIFDLLIRWHPSDKHAYTAVAISEWSKNVLGIYLFHLAMILKIRPFLTQRVYPSIVVGVVCLVIDIICLLVCRTLRKIPYVRELVTM